MAGNGALDLSIRIMGKVDPSLVTAIKQTKGLTGDLASALTGTKSLGSTVANTLGVIGKTGLGIMATLTTASAVMIKKTTSMAEEYQAQAADAVKYVGGIMNDDGSIDPEKRSEEHTSELQSRFELVCRLLLEKKKIKNITHVLHLS